MGKIVDSVHPGRKSLRIAELKVKDTASLETNLLSGAEGERFRQFQSQMDVHIGHMPHDLPFSLFYTHGEFSIVEKTMEDRKPGCSGPITRLFMVGCLCLLAAGACFYRYYSIMSTPSGSSGDFGISVLCGIGLSVVGIGVLSSILIVLVVEFLTRKK